MKYIFYLISVIFLFVQSLMSQIFISADPFNLIKVENNYFSDSTFIPNMIIRPILDSKSNQKYKVIVRSELYFNDNHPNFENMGNRFIGKGLGYFTGINISYNGKYLSYSIEPYFLNNQNKKLQLQRPNPQEMGVHLCFL